MAGSASSSEVYCECGSLDCVERIEVPVDLYEHVRRDGMLFLVKAGHERDEEGTVALVGDTYRVIALAPEAAPYVPPASARLELVPEPS